MVHDGLQPFASLLKKIVDNRGRTCPTAPIGIPLIATNCIKNDLLFPAYEKVRFVDKETYKTWFRGHPEPGDLLFVTKGTPGRVCVAPDPVDFCIAQDMVAIRPDPKKVYPHYLFALLRSSAVQEQIEQLHVGTLIPHFKKGDFDKLMLPILDRSAQEFIGDMYFALSAKIDLNRRMNETLEAMARAIFKSWFVDFDPVRAKAEGRQPFGMDAATAALFSDSFQDSPLGKIPKGWHIGSVGDEFSLTMGQSPPGSTYNEVGQGTPFFQGRADFGFRFPKERVYCIAPTRFAKAGDTLVSVRAPVGDINMAAVKCAVGRGVAALRHKTGSRSFTYYAMKSLHHEFARFEAEGTVFGSISKEGFAGISCIIPPKGLVERFERVLFAMDQAIENAENESKTLAAIRNALLPKLISGKVRVKDAQNFAEVSSQ